MGARACALALCCAALAAIAAGYTVDCNHEYTDCGAELSKLANDDEDLVAQSSRQQSVPEPEILDTTKRPDPAPTIVTTEAATEATTKEEDVTEVTEQTEVKPKGRLLNLNVDDLQSFANALHNQTEERQKGKPDLSDVSLDDDEDEHPRIVAPEKHDHEKKASMSDNFYTNLQAPFSTMLAMDRSDEVDVCKENGVMYKVGDHLERGCDETCQCTIGGNFECTPRCKHPYIRRGRQLVDPLCFESPVDECCSIVACSTGNGDAKLPKVEICRYGNETYPVGSKWSIGCEQKCSCAPNSVVTCQPRCNPLPQSDKCINVQDPNDACCEVQICDVSQDVHEEPENITSSTTTTTARTTTSTSTATAKVTQPIRGFEDYDMIKSTTRPLVLAEPIGSVKVLQNNSVQVNLIRGNTTDDPVHLMISNDGGKNFEDVELKYRNLILNLPGGKDYILKTKETGTKFNFTMTASNADDNDEDSRQNAPQSNESNKIGCHQDGKFYAVGEEFHIGCSELCECTGDEKRECAELVCPNHVGLELVSRGCVRWAPSPPPQPPNCCPRAARCLSDGTCHYKGVPVPNWSEVPIALTGCEQRCFCENGELDCQEVCSPLPPVPPQSLRCPPLHRPAPVNISDEDCCKQWGCEPNAMDTSTLQTLPTYLETALNYVTPVVPTFGTPATPTVPVISGSFDFFKHLHPVKSFPKVIKTPVVYNLPPQYHPLIPEKPRHETKPHNNEVELTEPTTSTSAPTHPPSKSIKWSHRPVTTDMPETTKINNQEYIQSKKPSNDLTVNDRNRQNYALSYKTTKNQKSGPTTRRYEETSVRNHNYILPSKVIAPTRMPQVYKTLTITEAPEVDAKYFTPIDNQTSKYLVNNYLMKPHPHVSVEKHVNLNRKGFLLMPGNDKKPRPSDEQLWDWEAKIHELLRAPNPYETVLLKPVTPVPANAINKQKARTEYKKNSSSNPPGPLDLEHLINQMQLESEVTRNLGRSAGKPREAASGHVPEMIPSNPPQHPIPSFLPTIPPEIHFPEDEDYEQNNVHRPTNSADSNLPALPPRLPPGLPPGLPPVLPPGLPISPNYGEANKKLSVLSLLSDSPTSVKLLFGLPPVLVGLRGSVDLRYTDKPETDVSNWYSQVFAPADEVLTTPRLEFRLTGLKPSTTYKIRGKLYLHNLQVEPESEVYSIRTQDLPTLQPVEEKRREIDCKLSVVDVNDTVAHVSWRHFSEEELKFIDGIQVRYRPVGTPIYSMTELLHHSRSLAELHELRPGTRYEASLILVPPPRANTELHDPGMVEFTTSPFVDPYNWTVTIEAHVVGSEAAELTWRGVPSPAERWVRVYRAAHACGAARREHDAFRLAARDLPPTILLSGLEADSRCRVWLELFLTNGKIKTSNVLEINTKSLDTPSDIDNEIEASSIAGSRGDGRGDYYGALVVVGVVAALGALTSLLLLLVLLRRHRPRSVPITPVPTAPRESSLPPYDNPAYKLELQQETMDL